MTTYLGKSSSFGLPQVPFVNCRQFMYLVISLLILRAGYGIWLYQFLIIAYLFTFYQDERKHWKYGSKWPSTTFTGWFWMRTHCTPRTLQDLPVKTRLGFYQDVVDSLAEEYMYGRAAKTPEQKRQRKAQALKSHSWYVKWNANGKWWMAFNVGMRTVTIKYDI